MGNINGNIEAVKHTPDNLLWGENEFASVELSLAANAEAKDGYIVVRAVDGSYKPAADADLAGGKALAVLVDREDFKNTSAAAKKYAVRVCIAGRVKQSLVTLGGAAIDAAAVDALRNWGIIALDVKQTGV